MLIVSNAGNGAEIRLPAVCGGAGEVAVPGEAVQPGACCNTVMSVVHVTDSQSGAVTPTSGAFLCSICCRLAKILPGSSTRDSLFSGEQSADAEALDPSGRLGACHLTQNRSEELEVSWANCWQ